MPWGTKRMVPLSAGQLTFCQTYLQNSPGTLKVRIGGLTPEVDFDQYTVSLAANLDGTLSISLVNGYVPNVGDAFEIVTFGSRSGTFVSLLGIDIGNGTHFEVTYGATNVVLAVVAD